MEFLHVVGVGYWQGIETSWATKELEQRLSWCSENPFMSCGITYTKCFKDAELSNHDLFLVNEKSFPK